MELTKIAEATLARVLDFLKFSEAKNAALVTFSSAWIIGLLSLLSSEKSLTSAIKSGISLSLPLFFVAATIGLISFLPRTNLRGFTRLQSTRHAPNLLYFNDISAMKLDDLRAQMELRYGNGGNEYLADLCIQIAVNSQIVSAKFAMFKWGMFIVIAALVIVGWPVARYSWPIF